jgi:hypothetical protein
MIKDEKGKDEFMQTTAKKLVEYESKQNGGSANEASTSANEASTSANLNNVDLGGGDGGNFIPSLLDGNLSPLEILINCGILSNIMILVHIILLVLILIQKFNIKIIKESSVGFISKYLNKYKLNKVKNFINKLGELNNKYLSLLIIINVILIVFYVFLNVYINIELSSYLNNFIYEHINFHIKEGGILLLLLNSEIKYKNGLGSRLEKRLFSSTNIINIGRKLGKMATKNKKTGAEIEASKSVEISKNEPVSPTEFNSGFIHSVLEDSEIPLIVMVNGLNSLNYIELSLVLSIFSLLFRKFLIRKLTDFIIKFIQKIKSNRVYFLILK